MSAAQARACVEKMKRDEAFRAQVMAVEDVAARMKLINAAGFACTAKEIGAVCARAADSEVDRVTGGWPFWEEPDGVHE